MVRTQILSVRRLPLKATTAMQSINHYTVQRVVDVNANIDSRDLGSVAAEIKKVIRSVSFSDAQEAVQAAHDLAEKSNHQELTPEHLLLALLEQQEAAISSARASNRETSIRSFTSRPSRVVSPLISRTASGETCAMVR